jgi:hypothetical protein
MLYYYGYFIGAIILALAWFLLFFSRKDLRRPMVFGSLLGLPFGFTEFMFVPEYWNPSSIFNLIGHIGFGFESLLFGFFVGGIASVIYEVINNDKVVKLKRDHRIHLFPYLLTFSLFFWFEFLFPDKSIYNLSVALILGAGVIFYLRKDLRVVIVSSGVFFVVVYFLLFKIFDTLIPNYISNIYTLENFLGINIWNIPIEEFMFAFSVGACWSTFYEYIEGYKIKKI